MSDDPIIWGGMTQAELDRAYDQAAYAPNIGAVTARYSTNSEIARRHVGAPERIAYGAGAKSAFDFYRTAGDGAPLMIFVHGGAWRITTAADYAFLAPCFVDAGAHLAVLDFDWVQDRAGDLLPIADQITDAVAWIVAKAATLGADPARIHLAGHSSGAHMAAVALGRQAPDAIAGALLASGMYDLEPVSFSARSAYVNFTAACVDALSPIRRPAKIPCPVLLAYGDLETPEFIRQSDAFAGSLNEVGRSAELLVGRHYNHFEIIETLANPHGLLGQAMLARMGLGR